MRPHFVVVLSPLLDPDLRVHAVPKPLPAQELVAELPVERFVGGILPRLPGSISAVSMPASPSQRKMAVATNSGP